MSHHKYSPSSLQRRYLCPFSVKEADLPSQDNEYSVEGHLLHTAVKNQSFEGLNSEQKEQVIKCLELRRKLIAGATKVFDEKSSFVRDNGKEILYGTADLVAVFDKTSGQEEKIVIGEYKFGRNEVEETSNNLQAIGYAVAAMQEFGINKCEVNIFQPRIKRSPDVFTFSWPDALLISIKEVIAKCEVDNPEINPGEEQCRYCKAKETLTCPAIKNELVQMEKTIDLPSLPNTTKSELFKRAKTVEQFIIAIKEEVRRTIEKEGSCADLKFKTTSGGYSISSIAEAFEKVKDIIPKSSFLKICTVSDTDLKELFINEYETIAMANQQLEKFTKKEAEQKYYEIMGDLRKSKTQKRTIVKN